MASYLEIKQINSINPNAMAYYQNILVPFTSSTKTKIAWADSQGAYTNIATRIYETRRVFSLSPRQNTLRWVSVDLPPAWIPIQRSPHRSFSA